METKELRLRRRLWQTRLDPASGAESRCSEGDGFRKRSTHPANCRIEGFARVPKDLWLAIIHNHGCLFSDCIFNERRADCDRIMAFLRRSKSAI
jgi:hypothetical protein